MRKGKQIIHLIPVYILVLGALIIGGLYVSDAVTVMSENRPIDGRTSVIIDAGHGAPDGGATSCTGVLESQINLEIALRLDDLMHLLGFRTVMIRTTDESIYREGETIAAKKLSDLKERVRIVNNTENAVLISIHQNYYSDDRYSGAQVFCAKTPGSDELAKRLQAAFVSTINPSSNRKSKQADGVYLMKRVQCPAVLIECGFLSNSQEEARLRNKTYQKKLCCVIGAVCSKYIDQNNTVA